MNVSGYRHLSTLTCWNNQLSTLLVSGCRAIRTLSCQDNRLTELDIGGCDALTALVDSMEPQVRGGVVYYGNASQGVVYVGSGSYYSSAGLSYDEGVSLNTIPAPDFVLPASLTVIGDEAFAGASFGYVRLPEQAVTIGRHAFADCPDLAYIYIPAATTEIDPTAFANVQGLTIIGVSNSAAEAYANEHGFAFKPMG